MRILKSSHVRTWNRKEMCNFCILFDFSTYKVKVEQGVASLIKAPTDIPFLPKDQFNFCPVCGSPRDAKAITQSRNFGYNLRRIRRMRGVTQEALGREIGVQKSAISKYEKGRCQPNARQIAKICRALDISPQELI